jgi:hypothetical protein
MSHLHSVLPYSPGPGDGLPGNFTIPGDPQFIIPAGLEAVLEYNGLFMNIRKNADRYRLNSIDGLSDADIRDTREPNTADDGESPYNAFYGGRTITINGTIDTYSVSKVRAMQYALRAAFADISQEYPLIFRTGHFTNDHMIYCKKIGPIAGIEEQSNGRATRDFQISLRASNPRFLSFYQAFAEAFPTPATSLNYLQTVENNGEYKAQPTFRVYGPATSFLIMNDVTSQYFSITKPIPTGDYLEYNMTTPPTLKNSSGVNHWNALDDDSGKIDFMKGFNALFYEGDSPYVQIFWRHSWI